MTNEELIAIVSAGEGTQIEFKRSTGQRSDAGKTACGMLNGSGGFVLFGVTDKGEIDGQEIGATTLDDVVNELRKIEPAIPLSPELVPVPDSAKMVVALRIPGGVGGPFTYDGRPFVRVGSVTHVMAQNVYSQRLLDQMDPSRRWEVQPAQGVGVDDLDAAEIVRTVEEGVRRGRISEPGTRDILELLRGLDLLSEGRISNGAVALFLKADRAPSLFPQCLVRLARFRGTTTAEFEDNRQFRGGLLESLRLAQGFLRQHLPVAGRIIPTLFEREDDPLYPPEALREALANAFCHRDFQIGSGSVSVAIFDDRLEVCSTGRLPSGWTVENLIRPHPSHSRNPAIANVLYRCGIIEQWGRGTIRIRELTQRAGLVFPEFEERAGEIVVRFSPSGYTAPLRIDRPLSPLEREILQTLAVRGPMLMGALVGELPSKPGLTRTQAAIRALKSLDLVAYSGWGRGAKWRVK